RGGGGVVGGGGRGGAVPAVPPGLRAGVGVGGGESIPPLALPSVGFPRAALLLAGCARPPDFRGPAP
ncbi:MAG: hypothetical protein RLZZ142_708, partial [Verrucomicrobiota bacterium]